MSALIPDYIWGVPKQSNSPNTGNAEANTLNDAPIKRAMAQFLNSQIRLWNPDLIIVIERKGTAVLRALMESDITIEWSWENVISSKVICEIPPDRLIGKRILIFDDMMKKGVHVEDLLRDLRNVGLEVSSPDHLRVAVFAVHEESSRGKLVEGAMIPHAWYRRGLSTKDYTDMRSAIVKMLQRSGSLMLDTEHLEVRVKLVGSFDKFVKALRRTGKASVFTSAGSRVNITVLYEDATKHVLPKEDFPIGTKIENIVKKCRVVQRSGNEFALIPICFPAIPAKQIWKCSDKIEKLLGRSVVGNEATDLARFYGVGMRAALRVLRWVLQDLYAAAPQEFSISLPSNPTQLNTKSGYHLGHLRVMYPTLDIDCLNIWIAKIENEAKSEGRDRRASFEPIISPLVTDEELQRQAIWLLQSITDRLDRKRIQHSWLAPMDPIPHPFGLTAAEIFAIGENSFGWERIRTSTLFDVLIDQATLVTHVQTVQGDGGETVERTFEPDGEVVGEAIRRYTTQWGLPDAIS